MADEITDTSDLTEELEDLEAEVKEEVQEESENEENDSFVGSYKSKEEAEKGIAEKDNTISRLQSERDKALATSEKVQNELLSKLTNLASSDKEVRETTKEDLQEMIDKIDTEGGSAVIDIVRDIMVESELAVTTKLQEKISALESKIEELNPEFVSYKEDIEKLSKEVPGLSKEQYIKIAKMSNSKEKQPKRPDLPGSSGVKEVSSKKTNSEGSIDPIVLAELKEQFPDLTKAEIKKLAKGGN